MSHEEPDRKSPSHKENPAGGSLARRSPGQEDLTHEEPRPGGPFAKRSSCQGEPRPGGAWSRRNTSQMSTGKEELLPGSWLSKIKVEVKSFQKLRKNL